MKLISSLAFAALSLCAGLAQAQIYTDLAMGAGRVNGACSGIAKCDNNDYAWRVTGGYQFGAGIGADVSWAEYGKAQAKSTTGNDRITAKAQGIQIGASYRLPLTNAMSLDLRGGIASNRVKADWKIGSTTGSQSTRSTQPYAGVGMSYAVSAKDSVGIGADFTRAKVGTEKANLRSFNVTWRTQF